MYINLEKKVISSFRCRMHSYILACELRYTCTCTFKSSIDCQEIPMLFKTFTCRSKVSARKSLS